MHNISSCTSLKYMRDGLISHLDPFFITIFNTRAFKFNTHVVVSVTFDRSSGFCKFHESLIIFRSFDLEWKGSDMYQ